MGISRRDFLKRGAASTAAIAQVPIVSAQAPAADADQKLKSALNEIKVRSQRMNSVKLPMTTEPAFRFRP